MQTDPKRPIFLNLAQIRFPITALVSIAHRLSGLAMVLLFPLMIQWLVLSLNSEKDYNQLITQLSQDFYSRLILWVFCLAFLYHLFAGVRHLIMDLDIGHSLGVARKTAFFIAGLFLITALYFSNTFWRIL